MQTKTIIDRIEIEPQTGNVGVRMLKQIVSNDGKVLTSEYHRTSVAPDADPAAQMALVDTHLGAMGYPAVKAEDMSVLNSALTQISSLRAAKAKEARENASAK